MLIQGQRELSSETARIFTEHSDEFRLSVARFVWPEGEPSDSFDIGVDKFLSVKFDAHIPVRPDTITIPDVHSEESEATLSEFFGDAVAQAIIEVKNSGFGTFETALTANNRLALAELQANSATTPPLVKALAKTIAEQNRAKYVSSEI